jgi:hypothetical protein
VKRKWKALVIFVHWSVMKPVIHAEKWLLLMTQRSPDTWLNVVTGMADITNAEAYSLFCCVHIQWLRKKYNGCS